MNRTEKEQFVSEFQERLDRSSVVYLTDFSGLDVQSLTILRQNLKNVGAEYLVVKNRLMRRALEGREDFPDIVESLRGPTGVVLGYEGAVEPAKTVRDFAKEHDDRPVFRLGVLDREVLEAGQIDRLAQLPSRDQLLSELAGALQAPVAALAMALGAKLHEMVGLLEALKQDREEGA